MTIQKPDWTFIGTGGNNEFSSGKRAPIAVVCHIMQGTESACDGWFSNPAAKASASFGVSKAGEIHCYVDPDGPDSPWANGPINADDPSVAALLAQEGGVNPNLWTISIEHEGNSGDALTEAQLAASAGLTAWLCDHFSIPADRQHIVGHYEFDSVNKPNCPGWSDADWQQYMSAVESQLTPPPPALSLEQRIVELEVGVHTLTATLSRLNDVLVRRFDAMRAALDPANPPA